MFSRLLKLIIILVYIVCSCAIIFRDIFCILEVGNDERWMLISINDNVSVEDGFYRTSVFHRLHKNEVCILKVSGTLLKSRYTCSMFTFKYFSRKVASQTRILNTTKPPFTIRVNIMLYTLHLIESEASK